MSEIVSNIYQELALEHSNISNELNHFNEDGDINGEKLNNLLKALNNYNNKRKDIQKEEGSTKTLYPAKIHYIFGAFYKCIRYLILEIIATKGKLIEKDKKKKEIKDLLKNITNITKLISIIDKTISKNQSDSTSEIEAIKLETVNQIIKNIDIFSDNNYKEILKTFEGLESQGDQEWLYNDENYKKAEDEMLRIKKLTIEKVKEELKNSHNYDDSRLDKNVEELKAILYSLFTDKIPFDVHIFVLRNLKDRIIIPWLKRYTIKVEDEDADNIYRAWVTTPFVDLDVMKYLTSIYFGQETDDKWDDTKFKTLKWTSIQSEDQNKEWVEISNTDKKELEQLFFIENLEFDELEDEEKNLVWLAINMVLRQFWRIPRYHKGKIWTLQPKCITKEIKGKIVELTLKYLEELLDENNTNHEKRKYHMAKIMGFVENNKDDDDSDNLNETSVDYLKNQYDELIKDINENIENDEDEKFKIYMSLFNLKEKESDETSTEENENKENKENKQENIKFNIEEKLQKNTSKDKKLDDDDKELDAILNNENNKSNIKLVEEKAKSDDESDESDENEENEENDDNKENDEESKEELTKEPKKIKKKINKKGQTKKKDKKKGKKKTEEEKTKKNKNKNKKKKKKKKQKKIKIKIKTKKAEEEEVIYIPKNIKENNASEQPTSIISGGNKTKKKRKRKRKTRKRKRKRRKLQNRKTKRKKKTRKRKRKRRKSRHRKK